MNIIKECNKNKRQLANLVSGTWFEDNEGRLCLLLKDQGHKAYAAYVEEGTIISYSLLEEVSLVTVTDIKYKVDV